MMPFSGTGAPAGGSPATAIDKMKLTGVQWQFTIAAGATNACTVDITSTTSDSTSRTQP